MAAPEPAGGATTDGRSDDGRGAHGRADDNRLANDRPDDGRPTDDAAADALLAAREVTHGFGDTPVLADVTLGVAPGEVLAVVGPSGTGKTTLLRRLAGFSPPDRGTVEVRGRDLWAMSGPDRRAARRGVGMVFQERSLFATTVRHNVAYGLRVRRFWRERLGGAVRRLVGRGDAGESVASALETVGLADRAGDPAAELSAGEAQRVAFARALAYDPDALLLDEPSSNLDPRNTAVLEEAVAAAAERDIGVVVATHDMAQARRVSDRTALLLEGRVVEDGPTERVFESPRDERTRKFIDGELVY